MRRSLNTSEDKSPLRRAVAEHFAKYENLLGRKTA